MRIILIIRQLSPTVAPNGSRRTRLWDLPVSCHCPLLGICLPIAVIHRIANKIVGIPVRASDYEMHSSAVSYCATRNGVSEAIQKDFDLRYSAALQQFKSAKTVAELGQLWDNAVAQLDICGPLWAALTHPRCTASLSHSIYQTIHMLQHQAGSEMRTTFATQQALTVEKNTLIEQIKIQQERAEKHQAERLLERERADELLTSERLKRVSLEDQLRRLSEQVNALNDITTRTDKQAETFHADYWKGKFLELQGHHTAKKEPGLTARHVEFELANQVIKFPPMADSRKPLRSQGLPTACLNEKAVLCVGGRSKTVPTYRNIVEKAGGKFAHHDGGMENNVALLESSMAAADLVICQTGCISHKSYFRVKDFCKRTGKQCVFVENPSASALCRRLEEELVDLA
jgi:hypothetical protein